MNSAGLSHPSPISISRLTMDQYDPLAFPRDQWPRRSYFLPFPGRGRQRDPHSLATQKASRKIAKAMRDGQVLGQMDNVDLTTGILDVVLEL